jgi:hypothetical protein
MVQQYADLCRHGQRMGWKSLRRLAFHRFRLDFTMPQPEPWDEDEMIHLVCAACKSVIGILDSEDYLERDADVIAVAHYDLCSASKEEKEQAVYDLRFRQMTQGMGL